MNGLISVVVPSSYLWPWPRLFLLKVTWICRLTFVFKLVIPPQTKFRGGGLEELPCLSVRLSRVLNLGYNFSTNRDKAFILHILVPCDKAFLSISDNLTLWPWLWPTFEKKNLTLAITFEPREIRLSYNRYIFIVARPFCPYQILTLTFDLLLKKLNLGFNFWTKRDEAFILHMSVPCKKTFLSVPKPEVPQSPDARLS